MNLCPWCQHAECDWHKPGPSADYLAMLRGEISSEDYVRRIKALVTRHSKRL